MIYTDNYTKAALPQVQVGAYSDTQLASYHLATDWIAHRSQMVADNLQ